jgi:hypothetical protein
MKEKFSDKVLVVFMLGLFVIAIMLITWRMFDGISTLVDLSKRAYRIPNGYCITATTDPHRPTISFEDSSHQRPAQFLMIEPCVYDFAKML